MLLVNSRKVIPFSEFWNITTSKWDIVSFAILRHENSVEINPIRDKNDREKVIYHSVYLKHIISEEMWGPCPTATILQNKHTISRKTVVYKLTNSKNKILKYYYYLDKMTQSTHA